MFGFLVSSCRHGWVSCFIPGKGLIFLFHSHRTGLAFLFHLQDGLVSSGLAHAKSFAFKNYIFKIYQSERLFTHIYGFYSYAYFLGITLTNGLQMYYGQRWKHKSPFSPSPLCYWDTYCFSTVEICYNHSDSCRLTCSTLGLQIEKFILTPVSLYFIMVTKFFSSIILFLFLTFSFFIWN